MSDILSAVYESAKDRMEISETQFRLFFAEWEQHPIYIGGEIGGAILCRGPEIHACILPKFYQKWLSKGLLRKFLIDRLCVYGFLRTAVRCGNIKGHNFVTRLGFLPSSLDGENQIYTLTPDGVRGLYGH